MQLILSSNQPLISRFIATGRERRRVSGKKSARVERKKERKSDERASESGRVVDMPDFIAVDLSLSSRSSHTQDWQDRDQEKGGEGEYTRTAILTIKVS